MALSFPDSAFRKADPAPDAQFYAVPRLVTHIDDRAIAAVTALYREMFVCEGIILDLMSSWVSHLPQEVGYREVVGHGMNAAELAANPRLSRWFVQDLNQTQALPLESCTFDGAALCVSVQYLQRPVEVLAEIARVLRPDSPVVITFSNRCFPSKAVAVWLDLSPRDQARLVAHYLTSAGFERPEAREVLQSPGDPLWCVAARTRGARS